MTYWDDKTPEEIRRALIAAIKADRKHDFRFGLSVGLAIGFTAASAIVFFVAKILVAS